jgi:hypothetical protein
MDELELCLAVVEEWSVVLMKGTFAMLLSSAWIVSRILSACKELSWRHSYGRFGENKVPLAILVFESS